MRAIGCQGSMLVRDYIYRLLVYVQFFDRSLFVSKWCQTAQRCIKTVKIRFMIPDMTRMIVLIIKSP